MRRPTAFLFFVYLLFFLSAKAQETETQYLSGTGKDHTVDWQFYCTGGMNSGKWTHIPVPSNWELQGFGKYNYGFNKDSLMGKEEGWYKYSFQVPKQWKAKLVNIVFDGVATDAEVKINGKLAGPVHQGAYYTFRYDISRLLNYGKSNVLEVKVKKYSANASVNAAERKGDFWVFGGIFRPVWLEALPMQHIERVSIDAKADGSFKAKLWTTGQADRVEVDLLDQAGHSVGKGSATQATTGQEVELSSQVDHPALWSSEFPNLYQAVFRLYQGNREVHRIQKRFGFRTIELRLRDGLYVNGVKMKFKGVNRHSFWPSSGRTTNKELSILDVRLMKEMNMNAVRMSHYPPDEHFLEVCDSLGLFVMDELAGWHGHYDTPTGKKLLKEMIAHDENHPSIVFWANGNEGGHNFDLDPFFVEEDIQKRPIIHPWQLFGGFDTQHYREYHYGIGNYDDGRNLVMPTEFLHGMYDGGHGAGLEDYWTAMWNNPLSAGGFLWDFADQGVVRTDKNDSLDTDGNRGADGIVGPHREKEGSFFAIKEIWSPVFVERREITPTFNGLFRLENRYAFTNLKDCTFSWKLKRWDLKGNPLDSLSGNIPAPDIAPFQKGDLQVSLPSNWGQYENLYLTAVDPHGQELFTWTYPIQGPQQVAKSLLEEYPASQVAVDLRELDSSYQVKAGALTFRFNKNSGKLEQVLHGEKEIPLKNGPILQQGINNFGPFSQHMEEDKLVIESAFDKKAHYNTLQWTVFPSGLIKLYVRYFPGDYFTDFVGLNFDFPEEDMKGIRYMGRGPYRVWKNRMKGQAFGIWDKAYNDSETGEAPWLYPEFKGYHAQLYWAVFHTSQQDFRVFTPDEDVFLRLYTPAYKEDQWKNYDLVFPDGDISFMQGIAGIGTKTQKRVNSGPMGGQNIYYDYEKEPSRAKELTLYFDFNTPN